MTKARRRPWLRHLPTLPSQRPHRFQWPQPRYRPSHPGLPPRHDRRTASIVPRSKVRTTAASRSASGIWQIVCQRRYRFPQVVNFGEIGPGDCYNRDTAETLVNVTPVSCDGSHQYQLIAEFIATSPSNQWPGAEFLHTQGLDRCPPETTQVIYPLEQRWTGGDHTIRCEQCNICDGSLAPEAIRPTSALLNS